MTFRAASDRSLLVSFGSNSPEAHRHVVRLTHALLGVREILNLHPAYASVLIDFDPRLCTAMEIESLVNQRIADTRDVPAEPARLVKVPVRYGGDSGPDLDEVARHAHLSPERVVELHSAAEYQVAFVGFATCFPYLIGLAAELATPRLAAPRKHVPAGSVAIGGAQAGIYPLASPGGWRLIGRTSLPLFDAGSAPPALLRMGDRVRFVPASERQP